jgi:hypothetical protein
LDQGRLTCSCDTEIYQEADLHGAIKSAIMRNILPPFLILVLSFSGCTKNNSPASPGGNNPPPGGTPGTNGITVTAISALNPYPGDVITLTGTGFDPDPTKDTITMGFNNNGRLWNNVGLIVINNKTKIISATTTEIKFTNDSALSSSTSQGEKPVAFQIKTPSGTYLSADTILFKDNLVFAYGWSDPMSAAFCPASIFAGDSLFFNGKGLYPPLSVSLGGAAIPVTAVSKADLYGNQQMRGFLQISFFGSGAPLPRDCQPLNNMGITIRNGDGRVYTYRHQFFPGPNSQILSSNLDAFAYHQNGSKDPVVTLAGYALRSDYTIGVTGMDAQGNPFKYEKPIAINGYPNSAIVDLPLGSLPPPDTNGISCSVAIKIGDGPYDLPFAYFTLLP